MEELFSVRSTNGRWGLSVVGPAGVTFPARGGLTKIGTVDGIETYRFDPSDDALCYVLPILAQAIPVGGCSAVRFSGSNTAMDLQSGSYVSLLLLSPVAVVKTIGYKGRSSSLAAYVDGVKKDIPAPVLLAMGLVPAPEPEAVPGPPALDGGMQAALAAAGLL